MESSACDVTRLYVSLCRLVSEHRSYIQKIYTVKQLCTRSFDAWQPPDTPCIKINFDAHVGSGDTCGLVVVLRDDKGNIILTSTRKIQATWNAKISEASAALYGLILARRMCHKKIHLEGDAINVINAIQKQEHGLSPLHLVYDSCFDVLDFFDLVVLSHVRRVGNTVAHMVARWNTEFNTEKVCMAPFPECLRTLAMLDLS
ncbi:unnamed protein product [Amaranthus hypochondriacus]